MEVIVKKRAWQLDPIHNMAEWHSQIIEPMDWYRVGKTNVWIAKNPSGAWWQSYRQFGSTIRRLGYLPFKDEQTDRWYVKFIANTSKSGKTI